MTITALREQIDSKFAKKKNLFLKYFFYSSSVKKQEKILIKRPFALFKPLFRRDANGAHSHTPRTIARAILSRAFSGSILATRRF